MERSYVSTLELYAGEKIRYAGESVEGEQATVRTKIVTKQGTEIPVDYRMHWRGDRWLVYDVVIEGISLVANYRSQFNAIIRTSTDRKSTRLNSSHANISYAVFCLKKKNNPY